MLFISHHYVIIKIYYMIDSIDLFYFKTKVCKQIHFIFTDKDLL